MWRVFLSWWGRQLLDLLPSSWRRRRSESETDDAVLLTLDDAAPGQPPSLGAARRRKRRTLYLGHFSLDAKGLDQLRSAIGGNGRRGLIRLLLPSRLLLEQDVTLPLAAERGLETALRWEMDRLTPFPADSVFWSWTVEQRDRQRSRLLLRLRLVPKIAVAATLEALASAGLQPTMLAAADAPARAVPLTGHNPRRRGNALTALAAIVACLLVAVVAIPFVRQELLLRRLDANIDALRPQIEVADGLRRRLSDRAASVDVVSAEAARVGDALHVLATLTDVLPDDTYLYDLTLRDRHLTLSGQSAAAARLIPALAAEPDIRNPVFSAPVTRNEITGAQTFSIRAEISP